MLTSQHIKIIKSTVPLLEAGGSAITNYFYERMFKHNPELKNIFNMSNQETGRQKVALFEAILAYAKNIDNLAVLKSAVERIAQKHTSFHILPEHYDIVGLHLIETLRELLPEQFSLEVEDAWATAYGVLANIFINREEQLYSEREQAIGGWRGKRAFAVVEKNVESALVTSFIFEPMDQQPVLTYEVGQYLGIELTPHHSENIEIRQYSLSDKSHGKNYRISVKRETMAVDGKVSNYLHDHINVGDIIDLHPPAGDFFFVERNAPVVLVSAGVGITPMQAMLEQLAENKYEHQLYYLHACENALQHSFKQRTAQLCQENNWQYHTWYNNDDVELENTTQGFIDFNAMPLPLNDGNFYLCGPVGFMQLAKNNLLAQGVDDNRIHYEVFGPHNNL